VRDPNVHQDQSQSSDEKSSDFNSSSSSSSGGSTVAFDLSHLVLEDDCDASSLRRDSCSSSKEKCVQGMDETLDQGEVADDEFEQSDMAEKGRNSVDGLDAFFHKCNLGENGLGQEQMISESFQRSPCMSPILENTVNKADADDGLLESDTDIPVARIVFQRSSFESTLHSTPGTLGIDIGKEEDPVLIDGDVNASMEKCLSVGFAREGISKFSETLEQESIRDSEKSCDYLDSNSSSGSSSDGGPIEFALDRQLFMNAGSVTEEDREQLESKSNAKDSSRSCQSFEVADESIAQKEEVQLSDLHSNGSKSCTDRSDAAPSLDEGESSDEAEWSANDATVSDSFNKKTSHGNEVIIVDDSDEISYDDSSIELGEMEINKDFSNRSKANCVDSDTSSDDSILGKPTKIKLTNTINPNIVQPTPPVKRPNTVTLILDDSDSSNVKPVHHRMPRSAPKQSKSKPLNFKRNRENITNETFHEFNTSIFKGALSGVDIQWSTRLTKTAGLTRLKRRSKDGNAVRIAAIELSTKLIDGEDRLRSTLCHEMCHAAQWLVDNVAKPPHGSCFKKWAGLSMRKINGMLVTTTHDYVTNSFKFAWACSAEGCPVVIQRHSRSLDPDRHCCGKCKGKFVEIEVPSTLSADDVAKNGFTPKKKKKVSGFSLFVQANSAGVRATLQAQSYDKKIAQTEVMKECGRLWRDKKGSV